MPRKADLIAKAANELREEIAVPEGVTATAIAGVLSLKGPKGSISRHFVAPNASFVIEGSKVIVVASKASKKEKKNLGSIRAHMANMMRGVTEGHVYKLKVCYTHFPITVTVSGRKISVKNLLGEKTPREVELPESVKAKVEGADVIIESVDKESAGLAAAAIEQLTKRANYDKRVFADGLYITVKDGKDVK